jgi:hypothetical protein
MVVLLVSPDITSKHWLVAETMHYQNWTVFHLLATLRHAQVDRAGVARGKSRNAQPRKAADQEAGEGS